MSFDLKIINGDLRIEKGDILAVENSEKLIQDLLKIAITDIGANPIYPWYGSYLSRSMVGNILDESITIDIARQQLSSSIDKLIQLQKSQLLNFQSITADEHIANLQEVNIIRSETDPRLYFVSIKCISKGIKPITTVFNINTI